MEIASRRVPTDLGQSTVSDRWERLPGTIQRIADIGASESDDDERRLQRRVLNLTSVLVAGFTPIWTITYAVLGLAVPAAIPLVYTTVTAVFLSVHARTGSFRGLRLAGLLMMLTLPFLLQSSLGGFANGSMVALWALTAPLAAMFYVGPRYALPWFAGFAALCLISVAVDSKLAASAPDVPEEVRIAFFGLDLLAVSATVFLLLQYFVRARDRERARSERLLLNVLPVPIAARLRRSGDVIADAHPAATVLFADLVGFTPLAGRIPPEELVLVLDDVFTRWDALADIHGVEKIKTIGDSYMVVGGVPSPLPGHVAAIAEMALDMLPALAQCEREGVALDARIGIDTGPLVAGVIGRSRFSYDLWGDTVNTASRMESSGEAGRIHVSDRVREALGDCFDFTARGELPIKGKGAMRTHFLNPPEPD